MTSRVAVAAAIALASAIALPGAARSHEVPARRTVTVQAEASAAVVLVTWTSARGPQGAQLLAKAAWGRKINATKALRTLAGAEALRGLAIEIDGAAATPSAMKVKVRLETGDASDPPRIVCAVLLTFDLAAGRELAVHDRSQIATGIRWIDVESGAKSALRPSTWLRGRRTLRLAW